MLNAQTLFYSTQHWKPSPPLNAWPHQTLLCTSEPNAATEGVAEACFRPRGRFTQCQAQATGHFWRELTTRRGLGHADSWASPLLFLLSTTCWALTAATECPFGMNDTCTALGGTRCLSASNTWCSRPTTKSHLKLGISVMRVQIVNTKKNHFRGFYKYILLDTAWKTWCMRAWIVKG